MMYGQLEQYEYWALAEKLAAALLPDEKHEVNAVKR